MDDCEEDGYQNHYATEVSSYEYQNLRGGVEEDTAYGGIK